MKSINHTLNYAGNTYSYSFQGVCPLCHCYFEPVVKHQGTHHTSDAQHVIHYEVYECPACFHPFIAIWETHSWYSDTLALRHIAPANYDAREIDKIITAISPSYADIYHEAEEAEARGLLKICGAGYRKALEFLIKDYAIYLDPSAQSQIESEFLSNTIKRLDSNRISTAAKKCSWLGNDHVHYKYTHSDKDIQDMKQLLKVTEYWILCEECTKQDLS